MSSKKLRVGSWLLGDLLLALLLSMANIASAEVLNRVEVNFRLVAGNSELKCGKRSVPLGLGGVPVRLKDARLYISDVRLIAADGSQHPLRLETNAWQHATVALLDFEDGTAGCDGDALLNTKIVGLAPRQIYSGIRFEIGVPVQGLSAGEMVKLNHSNVESAAPPLDLLAMNWNWQGGRKFVKLEFFPSSGVQREYDRVKAWTFHLGSTGCHGNPARGDTVTCTRHNRRSVLVSGFDPRSQILALDAGALFAGVDLSKDGGGASGCMSSPDDPECRIIDAWLDADQERIALNQSSHLFRVVDSSAEWK